MTTIIHISPTTPIVLLLLISQPALAQTSASEPSSNSGEPYDKDSSPSMLTIFLNLMAAIFLMGFFCFSLRYCTDDTSTDGYAGTRMGSVRRSCRAPRGLDLDVIESYPIFDYAAIKLEKIGKGALECAVCLTEFEDDDTLRLIPKCDHVFHPDCIDPWLVGHTTCPLCRCNLTEAVVIGEKPPVNDVVVEVVDEVRDDNNDRENERNESMEQPLHGQMNRSRTMRNLSFGRPRWLGKIARSFSTGHVAVKQWENMERFTLRLPEEIRKQIMSGKLEKTTSLVILPRERSTRGSYPSRGQLGSRSGRRGWSDWWGFSLSSPFFTRTPSLKSTDVAATKPTSSGQASSLCGSRQENVSTSREITLCGAIQAELTQLPV